MFDLVTKPSSLRGSGVEFVKVFIAVNQVQVSFPGHESQMADAELAVVRQGGEHGKLGIFAFYWLHTTGEGVLMRYTERVQSADLARHIDSAINYMESMGFMMEGVEPPPGVKAITFFGQELAIMGNWPTRTATKVTDDVEGASEAVTAMIVEKEQPQHLHAPELDQWQVWVKYLASF